MKTRMTEIVEKSSSCDVNKEAFDTFCTTITDFLTGEIKKTCDKLSTALSKTKRTKLWALFHQLRTDRKGPLLTEWNHLLIDLGIEVYDPICMQSVYERLFECIMKNELIKNAPSTSCTGGSDDEVITLSTDELNALRYAAGFVPHSLLKRFEKRHGDKYVKFVTCLGDMAVAGDGSDVLSYTEKWFDLVNRGGLFPLNDTSFSFFISIEKVIKAVLEKHIMLNSGSDKESFKKNVHDVVMIDDDVQFYWCLLSQDIDDSEQSQELLLEVVKLWVTTRGFSIVALWIETYKQQQKKTLQKSISLRKSISGSS